jgi:uncharacterized protein YkwD
MAEAGRISHNPNVGAQIDEVYNWTALAENVGSAPSADAAHGAFMNSQGHRVNILKPSVDYLGVGCYRTNGAVWVVQVFVLI